MKELKFSNREKHGQGSMATKGQDNLTKALADSGRPIISKTELVGNVRRTEGEESSQPGRLHRAWVRSELTDPDSESLSADGKRKTQS